LDPTSAKPLNDADLLRRIGGGDRSALGVLVERHQRRVLEIAGRIIGDSALAEDIAQDTFLRIWRSADRYRPQAKFTTWLYRVVVNLCLDNLKKRRKASDYTAAAVGVDFADASVRSEEQELAALVRRAVERLPDRQRIAVVMHRFSGLPLAEIVVATGWSASAVESLLVRAYASLRQSLQEWEKK